MYANDQRFFVIRTIENADASPLGQAPTRPPEKVVVELLRRGRLEGIHLASLRIHAGHDVFDRSVLAGGVHRLKDQQQTPTVLRVQLLLQPGETRDSSLEPALGLAPRFDRPRVVRVDVFQPECASVPHSIRLGEPLDIWHGYSSDRSTASSAQRPGTTAAERNEGTALPPGHQLRQRNTPSMIYADQVPFCGGAFAAGS